MTAFIYQWTRREYELQRGSGKNYFDHAASNVFKQRGMTKGDMLYVVACFDDQLYLLGRLDVAAVYSPTEAASRFRRPIANFAWASDHAVCEKGEEGYMYFDLVIPNELVAKLELANGSFPLMHKRANGSVPDGQTFRTVRELSEGAVDLLEDLRTAYEERLP